MVATQIFRSRLRRVGTAAAGPQAQGGAGPLGAPTPTPLGRVQPGRGARAGGLSRVGRGRVGSRVCRKSLEQHDDAMADMLPVVMPLALCNKEVYSAWHPTEETMKRVAFYLRVSTAEQSIENQERDLRAVAEKAGWTIAAIFTDAGVSGSKGRDKRPGFDALLHAAVRREFDIVAAWKVDRLGRSLQDLVNTMSEIRAAGLDLYIHQQAVDTTTPAGKALFGMLGVFAEFELDIIRERINSGIARAKAKGQRFGRPRVDLEVEARVRALLGQGHGILKTAALAGVGSGTVQRIKASMA